MCDKTIQNGAGIDRVAEDVLSLKNWPFVGHYTSAQNYLFFYDFSAMRTKRKKYDSVSNAKKKNAAASHHACYDKNGETPLQAALHARQQQAIAADDTVAAEAAAKTAEDDSCKSQARFMHQRPRSVPRRPRYALDSLRRSSDSSSLPSAV